MQRSALRVKQTFGPVCRYAVATGHAERDPSADLRGALVAPVSTHYAAITGDEKMKPAPLLVKLAAEGKAFAERGA